MINSVEKNTPERMSENFETSEAEKEITLEDFYAELTDPAKHNPDKFCYIVHGVMPESDYGLMSLAIREGRYDPSQSIDLLREPERVIDKKLISTSIISEKLRGTWGDSFFILDVPWDNFVSMSPRDSATNITNPDFVLEHAQHPITTPSRLIEQTRHIGGDSAYNEVVVTGKKNNQPVKITGAGLKLTDTGEKALRQPKEADRMREIAKKLNVPVIELIDKVRIEDAEPEVNHGYSKGKDGAQPVRSIYVNRDGYRYCFVGDWDGGEIKDIFRGDKNFYGGYNPVTKKEYLKIRPDIADKLTTPAELDFLRKVDKRFGLS